MAEITQLPRSAHGATASAVSFVDLGLRSGIVALTVATGLLHLSLGGLLFTLNGLGYLTAAVAMVIPLELAIRYRGLVRIGLVVYAATTIVGWYLMGPRYETAYVAKAIEIGLIALLAVEIRRHDGSPVAIVRRALGDLLAARRRVAT
ncbi:MAG TPA: hypothetical protein VFV72_01180 [Candidatus Limnocylindrales bacterium]|nr:hypothetical protein [Candidatus Limnocylindrales bacterium]